MARRKDESFFDLIAELPWWVGVVLATLAYVFIKFVFPAIVPTTPAIQAMARGFSQMAWLFALPFLVVAIVSAVRQFLRKRLLDRQVNLDSIRALPWEQFEHLVGEVFRRQGYWVEERGGSAPDGGIDLVLLKGGRKLVVQCKRWQTKQVGVTFVRELYGVMTAEGADEALFVSSGEYTDEARAFANGKPIQLIDGNTLLKMIRMVQPVAPQPAAEESVPSCPKCARPMVKRAARSGPSAGQGFWGCSAFPQCRGTRPLR